MGSGVGEEAPLLDIVAHGAAAALGLDGGTTAGGFVSGGRIGGGGSLGCGKLPHKGIVHNVFSI
jgi:hypothetical protein